MNETPDSEDEGGWSFLLDLFNTSLIDDLWGFKWNGNQHYWREELLSFGISSV